MKTKKQIKIANESHKKNGVPKKLAKRSENHNAQQVNKLCSLFSAPLHNKK